MTEAEEQFLLRNQLPDSYLDSAEKWFSRLIEAYKAPQHPALVIGINGTQGSGKSTLADYLCTVLNERYDLHCVSLSIDDFYLTKDQRHQLATEVHPLLATRGVPGTHDIALALQTVDSLLTQNDAGETIVPRFDKSCDDRQPLSQWDKVSGAVDIIVLEGWCIGAKPQQEAALSEAINKLETKQDAEGIWRHYINKTLANDYQALFKRIDQLVMLRAPSFETVFNWRREQEEKLIARLGDSAQHHSGIMSAQQVADFIAHYQRITEHSLREMPERADHLFQLDDQRRITSAQ